MIFSRKINKIHHPPLYFNENLVKSSSTGKHLGMVLDAKLDFSLNVIDFNFNLSLLTL